MSGVSGETLGLEHHTSSFITLTCFILHNISFLSPQRKGTCHTRSSSITRMGTAGSRAPTKPPTAHVINKDFYFLLLSVDIPCSAQTHLMCLKAILKHWHHHAHSARITPPKSWWWSSSSPVLNHRVHQTQKKPCAQSEHSSQTLLRCMTSFFPKVFLYTSLLPAGPVLLSLSLHLI